MKRRSFFGTLFGAAAIAADPEKLLWTPGKKLISVPRPSVVEQGLGWRHVRMYDERSGLWLNRYDSTFPVSFHQMNMQHVVRILG